jgi:hypothetical protein
VPWRVLVRRGPSVEKLRCETLPEALDALEERARAAANGPRLDAVDLHVRTFAPADQISARAELKGPQRLRPFIHAGIDVRGDGSLVAWSGGVRREAIAMVGGETAYSALRRAVQSTKVEP